MGNQVADALLNGWVCAEFPASIRKLRRLAAVSLRGDP